MDTELKSCPFCGGVARYRTDDYIVECTQCDASAGSMSATREGIIAVWNRRTADPMTSVITWTRYDGTPETLPTISRKLLVCLAECIYLAKRGVHPDYHHWTISRDRDTPIRTGDLWAYLPEPPEGVK